MAEILLFGPAASGKTQLCYTLQGLDYSTPQQTGQEDYKVKTDSLFGKLGLSKYTIHEIGGKDIFLTNKDFLHQAFQSHERILFVFNGNDLIEELQNYQSGGEITSILRCYVMPALIEREEGSDLQQNILFIATHEDMYSGAEDDMETEIFSCLEKANEEYRKVANGTRYTFKKLLRGNLFCVDATDNEKVRNVIAQIIK